MLPIQIHVRPLDFYNYQLIACLLKMFSASSLAFHMQSLTLTPLQEAPTSWRGRLLLVTQLQIESRTLLWPTTYWAMQSCNNRTRFTSTCSGGYHWKETHCTYITCTQYCQVIFQILAQSQCCRFKQQQHTWHTLHN